MSSAVTSLDGRYRLDRRIDTGGYAEVWQAKDTRLARLVAVKILRPELAADPEALTRFRSEAQYAASLVHENVTKIFDYQEPGGGHPPFLVMELVDGPSLAEVLTDGSLEAARVLDIVAGTAAALEAAHQAGLVHRGVHPQNILLRADGLVKLTGFGICRPPGDRMLTAPASVLGSGYLAPEHRGAVNGGVASDLCALGMIAWECLAGGLPFTRSASAEGAQRAGRGLPLPPLPSTVPAEVAHLIGQLTAEDAAGRPASAGEVAAMAADLRDRLTAAWPAAQAQERAVPAARARTRAVPAARARTRAVPAARARTRAARHASEARETAGHAPQARAAGVLRMPHLRRRQKPDEVIRTRPLPAVAGS